MSIVHCLFLKSVCKSLSVLTGLESLWQQSIHSTQPGGEEAAVLLAALPQLRETICLFPLESVHAWDCQAGRPNPHMCLNTVKHYVRRGLRQCCNLLWTTVCSLVALVSNTEMATGKFTGWWYSPRTYTFLARVSCLTWLSANPHAITIAPFKGSHGYVLTVTEVSFVVILEINKIINWHCSLW